MSDSLPVGVRTISAPDDPRTQPQKRSIRFTEENRTRAISARRRKGKATVPHPTTRETPYSDDEWQFILAIREYKERVGNKFPSYSEVFGVVKSLGYVQVPHGYKLVEIESEASTGGHTKPESQVTGRAGHLRLVTLE
jgi:hypothetical protein